MTKLKSWQNFMTKSQVQQNKIKYEIKSNQIKVYIDTGDHKNARCVEKKKKK